MNLEIKPTTELQYTSQHVKHDPEVILPLVLIREHTRTDDVATVSDNLLAFYRKAALQAAEAYTGLRLTSMEFVTEAVPPPRRDPYREAVFFKFNTQHTIAQSFGYYYGATPRATQVALQVGSRVAMLPYVMSEMFNNCCAPTDQTKQARLGYYAGFSCEAAMPAAIQIGALKYIAHLLNNPGDASMAARGVANQSQLGADNPAVASGALEIWRTVRYDAI